MNSEYESLEKVLQKNESDIRRHIRIEQQLKLYSESQQQKIDESEQARNDFLDNTKVMLLEIKKENQSLNEQTQKYKQEIEKLNQKLKASQVSDQENSSKLANYAVLQERIRVLEKMNQNQENRRRDSSTNSTTITLNNNHNPNQALYSDSTINRDQKVNSQLLKCYNNNILKNINQTYQSRQTPPLTMVQPSPLKNVRKTRTPQLHNNSLNIVNMSNNKNSDSLKARIDLLENNSQNFGNNLKEIKNISNTQNLYPFSLPNQESQKGSGPHIIKVKEQSTIYNIRSRSRQYNISYFDLNNRNDANKTLFSHNPSTNSSINNSYNNPLVGITNRETQNSALGNHSTILGNPSSAQQNKRSKSFGINKLRGSISKQGNTIGCTQNNDSKLSNISQEYSDYLNQDIQNRSINENFINNCAYSSIHQQQNTLQLSQQKYQKV